MKIEDLFTKPTILKSESSLEAWKSEKIKSRMVKLIDNGTIVDNWQS